MSERMLAQLAALKGAPASVLKDRWRELFDREPPPYNRRFLESRLAYRIQELAYGGLSRDTERRLRVLADLVGDGKKSAGKAIERDRPVAKDVEVALVGGDRRTWRLLR